MLRDGAWSIFILSALFGYLGFAEALIFGGLAWFSLAILHKVPRWVSNLRPHLAGRWRLVNRLLLIYAIAISFTGEYIRTNQLGAFEAFTLLAFASIAILAPSIAYLKRGSRT